MDDIYHHVYAGSAAALIALDISAAFDAVNYAILLERLKTEFGIDGLPIQWIASYLFGRTSVVRVCALSSAAVVNITGVPRGSVLEPIFFTSYVATVGRLIRSFGVGFQKYADDMQLLTVRTAPLQTAMDRLDRCSSERQLWFWRNDLPLNPDKSEIAFFDTRQRLRQLKLPVTVTGCDATASDTLKTLGVRLDSTLSFEEHVSYIVRAFNFRIRALRHIRRVLTLNAANTMACSIVGIRFDNCNYLLYVTGSFRQVTVRAKPFDTCGLQCRKTQPTHNRSAFGLHWLPVRSRITFKMATICFKAHRHGQPGYPNTVLQPYVSVRTLRSSKQGLLVVPA